MTRVSSSDDGLPTGADSAATIAFSAPGASALSFALVFREIRGFRAFLPMWLRVHHKAGLDNASRFAWPLTFATIHLSDTENTGVKSKPNNVTPIMPKNTAVPRAWRIAAQAGVDSSETASSTVYSVKRKFDAVLRGVVSEIVSDPRAVEDELRELKQYWGI